MERVGRKWEHDLRNAQWASYLIAELAIERARRHQAVVAAQMAEWQRRHDEWVIAIARARAWARFEARVNSQSAGSPDKTA